jgi:zinc transport system permease protein
MTVIMMMNMVRVIMFDDFFVRALLAGVGVALVAGPLGCFIVWRRLAYFGDTLSHSALLGVVLAFLLQINITLAVFGVCAAVALSVLALQRNASLSSDSLLGMLAHSSLALGLVALAFMSSVRVDLMGFLFGDILAVSQLDLAVIYVGGGIVIAVLVFVWRALFAATVNHDLAAAEGLRPDRANIVFMLLMAIVIAISMKIVGVLLITALLIIPAATARQLARGPEQMAVIATGLGVIAVVAGLLASLEWDTPSGPSIVVAAAVLFVLVLLPVAALARRRIVSEGRAGR